MYSKDELGILDITSNEFDIFLNKANVIGVGVGNNLINNLESDEKVIKVLVEEKVDTMNLDSYNLIPKEYKGFKTDVIETGLAYMGSKPNPNFSPNLIMPFTAPAESKTYRERIRPMIFGYSVSTAFNTNTGTAGCLVYDDLGKYILSTNNILAAEGRVSIGAKILQPGMEDGGDINDDVVATLYRYVPIKYLTGSIYPENYVDAAIAKFGPFHNIYTDTIIGIGKITGSTVPSVNLNVQKSGRRTGTTNGKIKSYGVSIYFLTPYSNKPALFKDVIVLDEMASFGDSGSIIVSDDNKAVGMIMGYGEITYANPINRILSALNVKLYITD